MTRATASADFSLTAPRRLVPLLWNATGLGGPLAETSCAQSSADPVAGPGVFWMSE